MGSVFDKFHLRAKKFATRRFERREDREDFSQFAVLEYLRTGRHNLDWLFVDFIRSIGIKKKRIKVPNPVFCLVPDGLPDLLTVTYSYLSDPVWRRYCERPRPSYLKQPQREELWLGGER